MCAVAVHIVHQVILHLGPVGICHVKDVAHLVVKLPGVIAFCAIVPVEC